MEYKRNQVEEAIFRTFGAREERRRELKFRIKRLLVTDRRLGRNVKSAEQDQHYAFFGEEPPGSGHEIMFTAYQAFALLAAVILLEHGLPQASVVRVMRRVRRQFEAAHADILRKDPRTLFDQQAILAQARPGMIATNNTDPVFLVMVRLTASSVDEQNGSSAVAVCRGPAQLQAIYRAAFRPRNGGDVFRVCRSDACVGCHLSQTLPVKRGRGVCATRPIPRRLAVPRAQAKQ